VSGTGTEKRVETGWKYESEPLKDDKSRLGGEKGKKKSKINRRIGGLGGGIFRDDNVFYHRTFRSGKGEECHFIELEEYKKP